MSRIALLSPCFWPEVRRGGERFTRELADGLLARGHHPELITSHPGPGVTGIPGWNGAEAALTHLSARVS